MQRFYPILIIIVSIVAYFIPAIFIPLKVAIVPLLALVLFGMGVTLKLSDFDLVSRQPRLILLGLVLQYALMPLAAWLVGLCLDVPESLLVGLVILGACPGGTASNVMCYLARADVALSITLTTLSTILAVLLTPFLVYLYVGAMIQVPVGHMMLTILWVVLLPVAAGLLLNTFFSDRIKPIREILPNISLLSILIIIAIIVALNHHQIQHLGLVLFAAVFIINAIGFIGGYWLTRCFGYSKKYCKTIAIEISMQDSGLGVVLAVRYFSNLVALPSTIYSIWQNISASIVARGWRAEDSK